MNAVKYVLAVAAAFLLVIGCQKELSFENGGVASGTLKSASTGECLPSIIMGTYKVDSVLNSNNYIDVHVNITTTGTFDVRSDTVNGYSFFKAGTLGATGDNVVRLYGTGKPLAAGTNTFVIKYGSSVCAINIVVTGPAGGGGASVFTLGGAPLACTGAMANGTYVAGTALNAGNTLTVSVNVTTIGTFAIGVIPANGFGFGATGTFTTTGPQTVTLASTGTPAAAGTFNYSVTNGTSICLIPITTSATGPVATFTLGGSPGSCTGFVQAGTYTVGVPLTAANTVVLNVTVVTVGAYTITTGAVNGIQFAATGTFATTGPQTVTLTGTGTPTVAGANNYPATGGGNTCTFSITAAAASTAATFTLGGSPGVCATPMVNGTYTAGTALAAANTVVLNVNVTATGTYSVSTTTANGMQFSGSGTFTVTGPQTVTLAGTGTPIAAGTNSFSATGGGNTCTFPVTTVASAANVDYFPLTQNSWWSYDSDYTTPDSLFKKNTTQSFYSANTYRRTDISDNGGVYDSTFYRKSGNDYYNRISVDTFTSYYFDVPVRDEILFLKENAPVATTWTSPAFSGTILGVPNIIRYSFTITSVNGTLTVNGVTYTNVTKVDWKSQESTNGGTTYTDDIGLESWYAKGIGLIKFRAYLIATPTNESVDNLRYYQVF